MPAFAIVIEMQNQTSAHPTANKNDHRQITDNQNRWRAKLTQLAGTINSISNGRQSPPSIRKK